MRQSGKPIDASKAIVLWFKDVSNVNISGMIHADLQIPNGFTVTSFSCETTQISKRCNAVITNTSDAKKFEISAEIHEITEKTPPSKDDNGKKKRGFKAKILGMFFCAIGAIFVGSLLSNSPFFISVTSSLASITLGYAVLHSLDLADYKNDK